MDVSNFAALKKKLAKEPKKKKETGVQKPVDEFFKKDGASQVPEGEGPSKTPSVGVDVEGSQADLKRKNAGKGVVPPEKRKKKGGASMKDAPVIIVEEQPSSNPPAVTPPRSPAVQILDFYFQFLFFTSIQVILLPVFFSHGNFIHFLYDFCIGCIKSHLLLHS
ncbi:unnamed protein product [Cuscuta epithymum]|nr:unnamed protein product [Cuscuta epithymum]